MIFDPAAAWNAQWAASWAFACSGVIASHCWASPKMRSMYFAISSVQSCQGPGASYLYDE
jgi:CHASE2 domain-containing sensor protein